MVDACRNPDSKQNLGVSLGLILGAASIKCGRDKVTLICSPATRDVGAWVEQLLAGSTGKVGRGLIPVDREPLVAPQGNGNDRILAYSQYTFDADPGEPNVAAFEKARRPVVRIVVKNLYDLGQMVSLWEIAAAVAGSIIGMNRFNQPDVDVSKVATGELTIAFGKRRRSSGRAADPRSRWHQPLQ
jgi:transaldolase/glucose-6-phosphate isomerase